MKLDFTVNWGYQLLYSRRLYHPVYEWDGNLTCSDANAVMALELLEYPVCWWGLAYSPSAKKLPGNSWQNVKTRRGFGGLRVTAECTPDAVFTLVNQYGKFTFSAQEVAEKGYRVWPVGWKFGFCSISVTRTGYLWYRPGAFLPEMRVFEAHQLGLPVAEHRRQTMAELAPGKTVTLALAAAPQGANESAELALHLQAMLLKPADRWDLPSDTAPDYGDMTSVFAMYLSEHGDRDFAAREIEFTVELDNGESVKVKHYFRFHDLEIQLLEDVWCKLPLNSAVKAVSIRHDNRDFPIWFTRITATVRRHPHLELEVPRWARAGESVIGRVYAVKPCTITVANTCAVTGFDAETGWNEFELSVPEAALYCQFTATDGVTTQSAAIDAVYALPAEQPEVMVGCDFTTVPHDDNGDMDSILDYIFRTQMGNTVVFRAFRPYPMSKPLPEDFLLTRWGNYCQAHKMYVQSVNCHDSGTLAKAAGNYMHNGGWHEYSGGIYAGDPPAENASETMKEAAERFVAYVRADVEKHRQPGFRYGYGDAGGGARYLFQGGLEYLRAETMVPHTQHLLSLARPASELYGAGDWGVHIAVQHASQPYVKDWHLGEYFLSLYQAWMMGASNLYEEDSLFITFKELQQGWDDDLPKSKRAMTREFFRFAASHPRRGTLQIPIASIEGRYAAPFNGFVCGPEQNPAYSVWGAFGNNAPEWQHRQPEKMRQLLDVLMPGASTHPLRQKTDRRRFYFSGTPFGDFDQVPIEASAEFLDRYKLLLNLGWHSANAADQAKIEHFVAQGGTYFAGLPEYSMHLDRKFLLDMQNLALYRDGDWADFCGIRVRGAGQTYSGRYTGISGNESSSRLYSFAPDEDGECRLADVELCGAEVVVKDAESGLPLIVKHRYGKGTVYTLTAWCYPGHEDLAGLMAAFLRKLCAEFRGEVYVEDVSGEVFWNVRDCGTYQVVMMLNTDWSSAGNQKPVTLHTPAGAYSLTVTERKPKIVYLAGETVLETDGEVHLEIADSGKITVHGEADAVIYAYRGQTKKAIPVHFQGKPFAEVVLP